MASPQTEYRQKVRKDLAKKAIALAMQSRWPEAVAANMSILSEFRDDVEAYNRLGKALAELGRSKGAMAAFKRALEMSPHNSIARKNLGRLMQLGENAPRSSTKSGVAPKVFIKESGKTGVTPLVNLASANVLLKLAPGHPVELNLSGGTLRVTDPSGEYVGQVEPRLASRLTRLIKGGNRYDATVTSVGEQELTVIVREVYRDPSQAGTVSFPSRTGVDHQVPIPGAPVGYELSEEEGQEKEAHAVKDWSNDDTEPGDDEAFSPVLHRIIRTSGENGGDEDL